MKQYNITSDQLETIEQAIEKFNNTEWRLEK